MSVLSALVDSITGLFKQPDEKQSSSTGFYDAQQAAQFSQAFSLGQTRAQIHAEMNNMDDTDELVERGLDSIADCATGMEDVSVDGFEVVAEDESIQEVINGLLQRTKLRENARNICRRLVKYGNEFQEIVVSRGDGGSWEIQRLKEMLEYQVFPNFDKFGRPENPPYEQRTPWQAKGYGIPFQAWQIAQFSYGRIEHGLGTPLLKSARKNWKRLQLMEDGMAVARYTRAFQKLVHKVPIEKSWDVEKIKKSIKAYIESITKKKIFNWATGTTDWVDNPITVDTDFYIPEDGSGRGGVTSIDPSNAQLQNLQDIFYSLARLLAALRTPKRYLNIDSFRGSTLSESGLKDEDRQFARILRGVQTAFRAGVKKVIDIELVLKGVDPSQAKYKIQMAQISTEDQKDNVSIAKTKAETAKIYSDILGGLPEDFVMSDFMGLTPEKIKEVIELKGVSSQPVGQAIQDYYSTLNGLYAEVKALAESNN